MNKRIFTWASLLLVALALSITPILAQQPDNSGFTTEGASLGFTSGSTAAPEAAVELVPVLGTETLFTGGLVNVPNGGYAGGDAARMQEQLGSNGIGINANGDIDYRNTEDFTIPSGQTWTIQWFKVFAYQTGAPIDTATISSANFRIWDGPPNDAGSTVVFGDTTTNRLSFADPINVFRDGNQGCGGFCTTGGPDRPIQAIYLSTSEGDDWISLSAGTYWVDWQIFGDAMYSGPWLPYQVAQNAIVAGNALVSGDGGTSWNPVTDADIPTGYPLELYYIANDTDLFLRYYPYEHVNDVVDVMAWQDSDQDWYHVMVSGVQPGGNSPVFDQWFFGDDICDGGACVIDAPILTNGNYEWAMEAWNTSTGLTGMDFTTFNVNVLPVQQLIITYPTSATTTPPIGIEVNDDPGASWYNFYITGPNGYVSNSWFPAAEICGFGQGCIAPIDPLSAGTYSVWVAGWGPAGFGPYNSQAHTFTVSTASTPAALTFVYPMDAGSVFVGFDTLVWNSDPNALWYHIILDGPGTNDLDVWVHAATVCANPNINSTCDYDTEFVAGSYTLTLESWSLAGFGPTSTISFDAS